MQNLNLNPWSKNTKDVEMKENNHIDALRVSYFSSNHILSLSPSKSNQSINVQHMKYSKTSPYNRFGLKNNHLE